MIWNPLLWPRWVQGLGIGVVGALGFLLWLAVHDHNVVKRHDQAREAQAQGARDIAATERASDAVTNAKTEQEMHDAINAAPTGGTLSPAAHALACARLRNIGRIPPGC